MNEYYDTIEKDKQKFGLYAFCSLLFDVGFSHSFFFFKHTVGTVPTPSTEVLSYLLANLGFMRVACVLLFDVGFYRSFFYFKHTVLLVPTGSTLIRLCSSPSTEVVSY